jgi:hypothetical protein
MIYFSESGPENNNVRNTQLITWMDLKQGGEKGASRRKSHALQPPAFDWAIAPLKRVPVSRVKCVGEAVDEAAMCWTRAAAARAEEAGWHSVAAAPSSHSVWHTF